MKLYSHRLGKVVTNFTYIWVKVRWEFIPMTDPGTATKAEWIKQHFLKLQTLARNHAKFRYCWTTRITWQGCEWGQPRSSIYHRSSRPVWGRYLSSQSKLSNRIKQQNTSSWINDDRVFENIFFTLSIFISCWRTTIRIPFINEFYLNHSCLRGYTMPINELK